VRMGVGFTGSRTFDLTQCKRPRSHGSWGVRQLVFQERQQKRLVKQIDLLFGRKIRGDNLAEHPPKGEVTSRRRKKQAKSDPRACETRRTQLVVKI